MTTRSLFLNPWAGLIGVAVALVGSAFFGMAAFTGMALAIGGGGGSFVVGWFGIKAFGRMMKDNEDAMASFWAVFWSGFKLPLMAGAWWYASLQGGTMHNSFLVGLALVYSALIGWSVASTT